MIAGLALLRHRHVLGQFAGSARHRQIEPPWSQHERQLVSRRQTRDLTAVLLCPVARVTQTKLTPCVSKKPLQDAGSDIDVRLALRPIHVFFLPVAEIMYEERHPEAKVPRKTIDASPGF